MVIGAFGKKKKKDAEEAPEAKEEPKEEEAVEDDDDEERTLQLEAGLPSVTVDAAQAQALKDGGEAPPEEVAPPEDSQVVGQQPEAAPTVETKVEQVVIDDKRVAALEATMKEMREKMNQMDSLAGSVRNEIEEIRESVQRMESGVARVDEIKDGFSTVERSLRELSALYDLVSSQINPFIKADMQTAIGSGSGGSTPFGGGDDAPAAPGSAGGDAGGKERAKYYPADMWVLKWAEYLLEQMDASDVSALLDYYRQVNWIDDAISTKMSAYVGALKINTVQKKKRAPEGEAEGDGGAGGLKLTADEHMKSLMFIEKIKGRRLNDDDMKGFFDEVSKMKKA